MKNRLISTAVFTGVFLLGMMPTFAPMYANIQSTKNTLKLERIVSQFDSSQNTSIEASGIWCEDAVELQRQIDLLPEGVEYVVYDAGVFTGPAAGGLFLFVVVVIAVIGIIIIAVDGAANDVVNDAADGIRQLRDAIEIATGRMMGEVAEDNFDEAAEIAEDILDAQEMIEFLEQVIDDHLPGGPGHGIPGA